MSRRIEMYSFSLVLRRGSRVHANAVSRFAVVAAALTGQVLYGQLSFCNQTPMTIDSAVAQWRSDLNMWVADGWWAIRPGNCTIVVGGALQSRYYYSYAQQSGGGRVWNGDVPFCSPLDKFSFPQQVNCPPEYLHNFDTIDTGDSEEYTLNFTCDDCLDPRIVQTIRNAIPALESYANAAAPQSYDTPGWIDIGPVDIKYGITRGPLRLAVNGSQLTASVRAQYWISVSHTILGIRNGLASCGVDENLRIVDASLSTVVGTTETGKLTATTRISNLSFPNRCQLTFANIDVTDRIAGVVRSQLERIAGTIDARIAQVATALH
jgi:uncharacterized membrane protein